MMAMMEFSQLHFFAATMNRINLTFNDTKTSLTTNNAAPKLVPTCQPCKMLTISANVALKAEKLQAEDKNVQQKPQKAQASKMLNIVRVGF